MDLAPPAPRILLADAGPYSKKSLKLVRSYQIVPLIFARKNCKGTILKVAERKYIQIKYVPPEMVPHLATLLNLRPDIEKQFSPAKVCYHADRMTNRGRENAAINIGKLKCIELLTALTAVKVHRLDLINCPTAFRAYHPKYSTRTLLNNMSDDRVALFNPLKSESLFV
jgi:hypothetical protein